MRLRERLASEINQYIQENRLDELKIRLEGSNLLEITRTFARLEPEKQEIILSLLPSDKSARILKLALRFENSLTPLLERLPDKKLTEYLSYCAPDDARELIKLLPRTEEKDILAQLSHLQADEIRKISHYPEGSAGHLMNPHVVALSEELTVEESIRVIRKHAEAEMIFYLYVVNKDRKLSGVVSLRKLLTSEPHELIRNIMIPSTVNATVDQTLHELSEIFDKTGFLALPVTDNNNRLVGMISRDDVMDKIQNKTEDTLFKLGGVSAAEFYGAPVYKIVPLRFPWLGASLFGGILNAVILNQYTDILSIVIALTIYIPVLLGLAETVGTQTATLIIRGLALGQMEPGQFRGLIFKEILIGFVIGFLSGGILGLITYLWLGTTVVAPILLISVTLAVTAASVVGTAIPLLFKFLKIDPALASSAFVLTGSDLCTIFIYVLTATMLI